MNIHVSDVNIVDVLRKSTYDEFVFGSTVYGLNTPSSDTDVIRIFAESESHSNSFIWEHHNLQVKTESCDLVYTTIGNFVRNLLTGDMPANFEIIHSESMKDSNLKFLYDNKDWFVTYNTMKSFLGYAKRDLKYPINDHKRLCHAYRSYLSVVYMLSGTYTPDCRQWPSYDELSEIKNGSLEWKDRRELTLDLKGHVSSMRDHINDLLNKKQLTRCLKVSRMKLLDEWLNDLKSSEMFKEHQYEYPLDIYYDVIENGIQY